MDPARRLGWARVAIGVIFLARTTPLLRLIPGLYEHHGGPLYGWPEGTWRIAFAGLVLPAVAIEALCIVRTVAAVLFMLGVRARAAGIVAVATGYLVYVQEPFAFIFTVHALYLATLLLALGDGTLQVALAPDKTSSPATSTRLVRAFVLSIYVWSAIAKLRPHWLDGSALLAMVQDGDVTILGAWLGTVAHARLAAWATLLVEVSIPALLLARRTRAVGILVACAMHAAFEVTVHPDVFGWVMVVLLSSFYLPAITLQ